MRAVSLSDAEIARWLGNPANHPARHVQGGFVCAMLDEAMGFTASISQRFAILVPTLQVSVSYLRTDAHCAHGGTR
jgi:acyl-coenzyme A thioesterase PaaI-like protein